MCFLPYRIFNIFGFEIKLDSSWLILAVLIVWGLSDSNFPARVTDLGRSDHIALGVAAMLGFFLSLILHALAHSLVARQFGLGLGSITLFVFGDVSELDEGPASARSEFWIATAGPAMSLTLAGLAGLVLQMADAASLSPGLRALVSFLTAVNLVLALFNLLPAFPLDGGRALRAALWHWRKDVVRATRIVTMITQSFSVCLITVGLLSLFTGRSGTGLWCVLIGLYLQMAARMTLRNFMMRKTLGGMTVADLMTKTPEAVDVEMTIEALVAQLMLPNTFTFVPVIEGDHLLGYVDAAMLRSIARDNWGNTLVGDIFEPASRDNTVPPDMATADLVRRMAVTGRRKYMVARDQRLIGIVTQSDLIGYLSVLQDTAIQQALPVARAH